MGDVMGREWWGQPNQQAGLGSQQETRWQPGWIVYSCQRIRLRNLHGMRFLSLISVWRLCMRFFLVSIVYTIHSLHRVSILSGDSTLAVVQQKKEGVPKWKNSTKISGHSPRESEMLNYGIEWASLGYFSSWQTIQKCGWFFCVILLTWWWTTHESWLWVSSP